MAPSTESGRSHTLNKEASSDIIPSLRGDDSEQALPTNMKILRRATLKVDFYLIPILGMFFLLAFMTKRNIGNARVAGLTKSLHMTNNQFSTALTITYIPYVLVELPMNLLMKRLGANVTLPIMVILWGIVCTCQGAIHSYHSLLVCRFFLGALEGGLFPGIVLLLSTFYRRHAMQLRLAMLFSVTSLAGAFSGLLAFGIQHLNGKHGIAGWQWIFIIEGAFTSAFGLVAFYFVPASPRNFWLLTEEERDAICRNLADDWSGDADTDGKYAEVFSWSEVTSVFTDTPHVPLMGIPMFLNGVTFYGLAYFTPTIVSALGYSPSRTQLLTVPPYACSFVFGITSSYFCDKYKNRGLMATFCALLGAAGYAIFLAVDKKRSDYGALFLQTVGIYTFAPCILTWQANNVQPHYRRATAVAFGAASVNVGGIVSAWLFTGAPRFHNATCINLAFSLGMAVSTASLIFYFRARNVAKRKEIQFLLQMDGRGTGDGGWDSPEERRRLGDRHPQFEFTM
ncbi:MFS general substrate transporter [Russula vinacea]|nr:MFS general substrate transporter [Russula vinacea]